MPPTTSREERGPGRGERQSTLTSLHLTLPENKAPQGGAAQHTLPQLAVLPDSKFPPEEFPEAFGPTDAPEVRESISLLDAPCCCSLCPHREHIVVVHVDTLSGLLATPHEHIA